MQSRNHRGIYLIVYKQAHGLGSRGEARGFLIQVRLEKPQFVERAICRVEKFAVVFFALKIATFTGCGASGPRFSLLPECRCELEEAFSNLRGRPGSKTE